MATVMGQQSVKNWMKRRIDTAIADFEAAEKSARIAAAATATITTKRLAARGPRPQAPSRPGRPKTDMADSLVWRPATNLSMVGLDIDKATKEVPFWIVQEIGTAQSEIIRKAHDPDRPTRTMRSSGPRGNADYVRTVPAQRGRYIGAGLAFGTGPRGKFTRPDVRYYPQQQIYALKNLRGVPVTMSPDGQHRYMTPRIMIQREIAPKHMVAMGAQEGFRQYWDTVMAAARQMRKDFNKA